MTTGREPKVLIEVNKIIRQMGQIPDWDIVRRVFRVAIGKFGIAEKENRVALFDYMGEAWCFIKIRKEKRGGVQC